MLVMKFGGTSVGDADRLARSAAIVADHHDEGAVVVVSAVAGVTRRLLELSHVAAAGDGRDVDRRLDGLRSQHADIIRDLGVDAPTAELAVESLRGSFADLRRALETIGGRGEASPRDQDAVMSTGERLSSALMAAALRRHDIAVERLDARRVVVTDDTFRAAKPDRPAIARRARTWMEPLVERGIVVVTEGFIGATPDGVTTTMGFEASDLSAALLGAALGVEQVQIWTDVPGMLSTGHAAVVRPQTVERLSYDEAAELALFGAKVLHPDTVAPARERGIPVRILDSGNADGEGTWIGDQTAPTESAGGSAAAARAGAVVKAIAVVEDAEDDSFAAVRQTLRSAHPEGWDGRAIVCPVGTGIGSAQPVIERIRAALQGIDAELPLARRANAIPVAIPRAQLADAVTRLHDALVTARDAASRTGNQPGLSRTRPR